MIVDALRDLASCVGFKGSLKRFAGKQFGGFQRLLRSFLRMLGGPQTQLRVFWGANNENGLRAQIG